MLPILIFYSKFTLSIFMVLMTSIVQPSPIKPLKEIADFIDEKIYIGIKDALLEHHGPEREKFIDCVDKYFREEKLADKFYTLNVILDKKKILKEVTPFVDEASEKCTKIENEKVMKDAKGQNDFLFIIILIVLVSILLFCCSVACDLQ